MTRQLSRRGNRVISLPTNEWALLLTMALRPGEFIPIRELLTAVWGPEDVLQGRHLLPLITSLRKSLEEDPQNPRLVVGDLEAGFRIGGEMEHEER